LYGHDMFRRFCNYVLVLFSVPVSLTTYYKAHDDVPTRHPTSSLLPSVCTWSLFGITVSTFGASPNASFNSAYSVFLWCSFKMEA